MDYDVTELLWSRLSNSTSPPDQGKMDCCMTASSQVEAFKDVSPAMDLNASSRPAGCNATSDSAPAKCHDKANELAPSLSETPNTFEKGNLSESFKWHQPLPVPFSQSDDNRNETVSQQKSNKFLVAGITTPGISTCAGPCNSAFPSGPNTAQATQSLCVVDLPKAQDLFKLGAAENIHRPLTHLFHPTGPSLDLRNVKVSDASKGPCYRCGFVHRGHECETECIGCKSAQINTHSSDCPFRENKAFKTEDKQKPIQKTITAAPVAALKLQPVKPLPTKLLPHKGPTAAFVNNIGQFEMKYDVGPTAAARLSRECQLRGFNPMFRAVDRGFGFGCNVQLGPTWIYGSRDNYRTEKEAKEAVATQALVQLRRMSMNRAATHAETAESSITISSSTGQKMPQKPSMPKVETRMESFDRLSAPRESRRTEPTVTPMIDKKVEANPANGMSMSLATSKTASTSMSSVVDKSAAQNRSVDLPGDVQVGSIPGILEKAIANARLSITFNLPGNVSVEVAEAYGKAISVITRSRSRSRSPRREQPRNDRRRSRSRTREPVDYYRPDMRSVDRISDRVERRRYGDRVGHFSRNDLRTSGRLNQPHARVLSKDPCRNRMSSRP